MLGLYNLLLCAAVLLALPLALAGLVLSRRARLGLAERLTRSLPAAPAPVAAPVWVHAASVGEVEAAVPLLQALSARGLAVHATALTWTGRERLRERLPGLPAHLAPLDLPGLPGRVVRRVRPSALVLIETEIWPNLIASAASAGAGVVLVGARISDRTFGRYRRLRPLLRPLLERMAAIGARSPEDRERLIAVGAPPERTVVVGDLKLDRPAPPAPSAELRAALGPGPVLVAGSTHPGEEEALLESWRALRARAAPTLRLVLAPRHPERAEAVVRMLRSAGASVGLRSQGAGEAEVVVLDTLGELASVYQLADLAFCGGTLAPVGGHNLIEPVRAGRVVAHGPHVQNQRSQVDLLEPLGVLRGVRDAEELSGTLEALWRAEDRHAAARSAQEALERHRGALDRSLELVLGALEPARACPSATPVERRLEG